MGGWETHTHSFYVPGLTTGGWTIQKPKMLRVVGDEGEGSPELEGFPPAGPGAARGPAEAAGVFSVGLQPLPFQPPLSQAEKDLRFGDGLLDTAPTAQSEKEIIDKLDFIKIKDFSSAKDQVKRRCRLQEKICKRHI